jgi:mono/diheme cytochrome c family protein
VSGSWLRKARRAALASAILAGAAAQAPFAQPAQDPGVAAAPAASASTSPPAVAPAGVENVQRAWQNWTLNCQGCHRLDGSGSDATAPAIAGTVAKFLLVPGGREYLIRVPGVATSPLSDADLAEVMNWMLRRFDKEHLPASFQPYTAAEIAPLRARPLRLEASQMRSTLLSQAQAAAAK